MLNTRVHVCHNCFLSIQPLAQRYVIELSAQICPYSTFHCNQSQTSISVVTVGIIKNFASTELVLLITLILILLISGSCQGVNWTILLMSCIYDSLLKASKALCIENQQSFTPHSSLAVMISMCSHRWPGAHWQKRCCQSAPRPFTAIYTIRLAEGRDHRDQDSSAIGPPHPPPELLLPHLHLTFNVI